MRVLVSDDQIDVLEAIRLLLKGAGHQAETADSPRSALAAAEKSPFDLILMDMNYSRDTTSGDEGLDLLDNLLKRDVDTLAVNADTQLRHTAQQLIQLADYEELFGTRTIRTGCRELESQT